MTVRVGICGAGRVSRLHADGFAAAGATVAGFADPVAEAAEGMSQAHGAQVFASLDAMTSARGLDVVCIAVPHDLHVARARAAIKAGLEVFTDKPLALDPRAERALLDLARARGRRLGINHNLLFHPSVVDARRLIRKGAIGRPVSTVG